MLNLQSSTDAYTLAFMSLIGRIVLIVLTVVALSSHGAAQRLVYHPHEHVQAHDHGIDGNGHADLMISAAIAPERGGDVCALESCNAPQGDHSGSHFHVSCCGAFLALLPAEMGLRPLALALIDQPLGRSSVALGELRYPLLRPPCLPV